MVDAEQVDGGSFHLQGRFFVEAIDENLDERLLAMAQELTDFRRLRRICPILQMVKDAIASALPDVERLPRVRVGVDIHIRCQRLDCPWCESCQHMISPI